MLLQALASGSNGNSFLIYNDELTLLIDAGISRKRIIKMINNINIEISTVRYILITHAHTDHVSGLAVLSDFIEFEIIATKDTIAEIRKLRRLDPRFVKVANNAIEINIGERLELDEIIIDCFKAIHDIDGAAGYSIHFISDDIRVSYTTDNQNVVPEFRKMMRHSDFIIIEANHDRILLDNSRRPVFLKRRIRATHMNNRQTVGILNSVISERTKGIFLAHLSGECNSPGHVCKIMKSLKSYYERSKIDKSSWRWIVCTREERSTLLEYNGEMRLIGGLNDSNPVEPLMYDKITGDKYSEITKSGNLNDFF